MTDDELDQILKSAATPQRPEEYWHEFPKRITAKLHWQNQVPAHPVPRPAPKVMPLLAWGLSFATICILAGFIMRLQPQAEHRAALPAQDSQLAAARKCYQELEALFPNQLQSIVFDQQGPHLVLAAKADIPNSAPLYLKICGPQGCQGFVTFSGQQIRFNGENCEVLADATGQVMLVGSHQVWEGAKLSGPIRIEARPLDAMM